MTNHNKSTKTFFAAVLALICLFAAGYAVWSPAAHGEVTQEQTGSPPPGLERATFAAGCFWSMQAIFQQLKGVEAVSPGYAGGTVAHPSYELVETGSTGYAESINILYDPKIIPYDVLLKILLTVRNPTTINQQGPDYGPNYRSIIFYRNDQEKVAAEGAIRQVNAEHIWPDPIVTEIQPFTTFYRAESYHINYYNLHPDEPYCASVIAPEISSFREKYRSLLKQ
jgi:peptide-methionine (S)-S-oxide reductase